MRPAFDLAKPVAVSALPRTRVRATVQTVAIPPGVLALTLVAPALDLLGMVQPGLGLASMGVLASIAISGALLIMWLRFPRASWLAAAALAAVASLAMRLVGAEVAAVLALLAVVALGLGGAFAPAAELTDDRVAVGATDLVGRAAG